MWLGPSHGQHLPGKEGGHRGGRHGPNHSRCWSREHVHVLWERLLQSSGSGHLLCQSAFQAFCRFTPHKNRTREQPPGGEGPSPAHISW